jgi:redox-sensitive bicupin YhaK (pirin superfamily)
MEIVTYVLSGELAHQDSMGNGTTIQPGDVQRMSAGTGITHSEFNPSPIEPVHLLQIWILPRDKDIQPSYEQIHVSQEEKQGDLRLIASPDEQEGAVRINADVRIFASVLSPGQSLVFEPYENRSYWLQVARGVLQVNNVPLVAGDGASFGDEGPLTFKSTDDTEFLLFELP